MVLHEFRKPLNSKLTVILMALLLLANGLVTWGQQLPGTYSYTNVRSEHIRTLYAALPEDGEQALAALEQKEELLRQAIYEEAFPDAPYTADPGSLLTGDLYSERTLFETVMTRIRPVVEYSALLDTIRDNSDTLLLTGRYDPDSFHYRNVIRSARVYEELRNTQPLLLYSGAVELLPGNGITEVMVVLLCLLVASELLFSERSQGTLALCKPTCRGALPLIGSKLLTAVLWGTAGTLCLYGTNLLIGLIRCGSIDMGAPIQSVYGMIRSPFRITVGQYVLLFLGMKVLWVAGVMSLACVAAYVGKKLWQCMGIFLLMGGVCILAPGSLLNPFASGSAETLFGDYWNLNVIGLPVSNLTATVVLLSSLCLIAFGTTMLLHVKLPPLISASHRRQCRKAPSISISLLQHEAWKLLIMNGALWILLALIPIQALIYSQFPTFIPPSEKLYIQYSQILSGAPNAEKEAFLTREEARFAELYAQLDVYSEALFRGELSEEAYTVLTGSVNRKLENEPVFCKARDQYRTAEAEGSDYVCLSPYDRLIGREGKKELLRQTVLLLLVLSLGLSGTYAAEHETGMHQLLTTTEGENASRKRKTLLAVLYGIIATMILYTPQIVAVVDLYGLTGLSSPAGSVPVLSMQLGTVWTALLFYAFLILSLSAGISLLILRISRYTQNTAHTCLLAPTILLPLPLVGLLLL